MKRQHLILTGLKHLITTGFLIFVILMGHPAAADPITIPIWKDGEGRVRVDITLEDGRTVDFIVDTGMWSTIITPNLVKALALSDFQDSSPGAESNSSHMSEKNYQSLNVVIGGKVDFLIQTPEVLDLKFSNEPVYGVLGSEFLQQYTVGFDLEAGEMILSDTGPEGMFEGAEFVKLPMYSPFANLWMTDGIEVGDVQVTAFLDTGAAESLVNLKLVEALPADAVDRSESNTGMVAAGSGKATESYTAVFQKITAGTRTWANKNFNVSSGIFSQLRMNKKPAMLVGNDLLLSGRLIMDYPNGFVYFEVVK